MWSRLRRRQRLLLVLGIQASQFTVVLDHERQATRCVSHSQEETVKLQMAELNRVVEAEEASATTFGTGDSSITVHCGLGSGTSGNEVRLSQSGGDGKLQMAELNRVVEAEEAEKKIDGIFFRGTGEGGSESCSSG